MAEMMADSVAGAMEADLVAGAAAVETVVGDADRGLREATRRS